MRLSPPLDGWLVRHGGRGHRITIVFKASLELDALYIALVALGGQVWIAEGNARKTSALQDKYLINNVFSLSDKSNYVI